MLTHRLEWKKSSPKPIGVDGPRRIPSFYQADNMRRRRRRV